MSADGPPDPQTRITYEVKDLGRIPYDEALALQEQAIAARLDGSGADTLFLLEHPHVLTLGRDGHREHLLVSEAELTACGVTIHECNRGGDVTYHGPGQLVAYPIALLPDGRRDVHRYVRDLEEVVLRVLADVGIQASRVAGLPGVWVGNDKVAALGVHLSRWVTSHGFALNVTVDLAYFRLITPCGLRARGVTSIERLLGSAPSMAEMKRLVAHHFGAVFDAS